MVFTEDDFEFLAEMSLRLLIIVMIIGVIYIVTLGSYFIASWLAFTALETKITMISGGVSVWLGLWAWGMLDRKKYADTHTNTKLER
jgi:hypothetical protein